MVAAVGFLYAFMVTVLLLLLNDFFRGEPNSDAMLLWLLVPLVASFSAWMAVRSGIALLRAWIWFGRRTRTLGLADEKVFNLTFYSLLGGIIGAKLLLVLVDWRDYVADPSLLFGTIRTAGVLVGGVAGGAIVFVTYARRHGLPLIRLADAIVAPLALAQALGRFGCLSAGCCYGVPVDADHPLAVTFRHPQAIASARFSGQPLLAVQLIEALFDLALVVVLTLLWRRRPKPEGTVMWSYVLLYSAARLIIEFQRGDSGRLSL